MNQNNKTRDLLQEEIDNINAIIDVGYSDSKYYPKASIGCIRSWLSELQEYRKNELEKIYNSQKSHLEGDETDVEADRYQQEWEDEYCDDYDDYDDVDEEYDIDKDMAREIMQDACDMEDVNAELELINSIYHDIPLSEAGVRALICAVANVECEEYFADIIKKYKKLSQIAKK